MKRCIKCIVPKNYPGIKFNEEGICNRCTIYKKRKYLGGDILQKEIVSFLKNKKDRNENYDCVLCLSGGRDSSYLAYYLVKVLNLRIVAYCVDNGFILEQTKLNLKNITNILKVKLVIEENEYLKKCIKHHFLSLTYKPSAAMIGILCVGCKLGIDIGALNFAKKNKIPVILYGGTPFETRGYKFNIMKINPNCEKNYSFFLGYLYQIMRNPKWIMNSTCLIMQCKEFYYHYYRKILQPGYKKGILIISPFRSYIRWKEKEIVSTIENELKWKKFSGTESTWRGDCDISLLKFYLYKKMLGFNDITDSLSYLIMDGQINREEALERLRKEEEIPEAIVEKFCSKLGLNYLNLKMRYRKVSGNKLW